MNASFTEFIAHLKEKNDLVEVIGSYIKLERRGYNYWACCPFHHEKTPSFAVNAADKYYHCFACGASGDVVGFIKEYENVDFMQAVRILADRAGLEIPVFDEKDSERIAERKRRKDRLYALMKDAARFYLKNLYSGEADKHLDYLAKRGIEPSVMKKFGLGASLDYYALPAYLLANGYTEEECIASGACSKTENGRLIDAEGTRLIIPIIDALGDVVAFGGRLLEKTDRAKYKNTRETDIFDKSKTLFNLNLIKKEKRAGGISSIILVEGYMDVISLYQAGFHNVGASMGTSLTKDQARLLKRYTESVLISYDGDRAGQNANLRGLPILQQEGLKLRVVPLPDGLDPDDVIRERGAEGYQRCLNEAMPLPDFRILCIRRKYDLTRTEDRREFVREALPVVREAESATEREELIKKLSEESGVSIDALERDMEFAAERREMPVFEAPKKREESDREMKATRFVLCACLLSKPYATGQSLSEFCFEGDYQTIADFIEESRGSGAVRPSGIFDLLGADNAAVSAVLNLDYGDNLDGAQAEKYFRDCIKTLHRQAIEEKIRIANAALGQATEEERRQILKQIGEYTKELKR